MNPMMDVGLNISYPALSEPSKNYSEGQRDMPSSIFANSHAVCLPPRMLGNFVCESEAHIYLLWSFTSHEHLGSAEGKEGNWRERERERKRQRERERDREKQNNIHFYTSPPLA